MRVIENNIENELIVKNSKFITLLYSINNQEEINNILMDVKKNYKKATHYCYAYIIDDIKYANDDGEPSGTAGSPILNVLEKNKLINILCIVVRYYGGIKLGAGGLIRAYSKSVRVALLQATLKDVIDGYVVTFELEYDLITTINSLLNNYRVLSKIFEDKIKYSIFLETLDDEILMSLNELNIKYEVEKKCL